MAAEGTGERVTEADIAAFAEKLQEWGQNLPPKERALLEFILSASAGTGADDIRGYRTSSLAIGPAAITVLNPALQNQLSFHTGGERLGGGPVLINGTMGHRAF